MKYCKSSNKCLRWSTREVKVGNLGVGGDNPIRIQSMTTSSTRDVDATVEQIIRLSDAGCEIARVTVQGKKEAEACEAIKNTLVSHGYDIPLVADIHFYPPAAMLVADFVDKVRINPGNFVDKRATFKVLEYSEAEYLEELERIEEKFTPLVLKCKKLKRALRIGTNHGSLSDRIMNRYGDTPMGMVESALEYARICRRHDFHDIIFSMKASNTQVMIQAYRLLVSEMIQLGWNYPLHLGVTEAGEGEDGRVKSAIGIGSLLLDGLGDTIRVSLTEDPWHEIDPCRRLVSLADQTRGTGVEPFEEKHRKIIDFQRREVEFPNTIPLHQDGTVALIEGQEVDFVKSDLPGPVPLKQVWQQKFTVPLTVETVVEVSDESENQWNLLKKLNPALILLNRETEGRLHYSRKFFDWLIENKVNVPVLLNFHYEGDWDDTVIRASAECGALLCDGLGNGLLLEGPYPSDSLRTLSFNILQGSRMRAVKTEFISCPSCGRTLFNLQEVSARIREKTAHLPGVKIAIMGCIVNGPGEMADADFGYVGSKTDKVDLYVGKTCVEKNIDHTEADERLIELIKSHGKWVKPNCSINY
ncbi:MAG: 4-hydroxy-3-methylbut-2-en-1-yl diphosphate synthase (ferredoxin) [Chlamydiae bacterium]|nr:4-hydroxy-3-methylbut-2-en-1-yl diphosphate synthase (ferredoxin) [Chlamydiota bacterium]